MQMTNVELLKLKLIREDIKLDYGNNINSGYQAGNFFKAIIGSSDRETFVMVGLDKRVNINNYAITNIGVLDQMVVSPREIFKYVILSNSYSIIIAHNHPSGDLTPSSADLETTKTLVKAADVIGINIYSSNGKHIVI